MGRTNFQENYRNAINAALAQRDQLREEIESLKNRRVLIEEAARALEPLIYPDEYPIQEAVASVVEVTTPPPAELDPLPTAPAAAPDPSLHSVPAITQIYVRGEGESTDEIQRRINIALGRAAAD